jgi:hypothetical protein
MSALRQATGCLTDAGLDELERAGPGQAPEELARHLAGCARCQDRVLLRARGPTRTVAREPAARHRLWLRVGVVLAAMLLALFSLLATLFWIRNP